MTDDLDKMILNAESALKEAENDYGMNHVAVAEQLENLAVLLRQKKRLLDAVNCEARARVIRTGDSRLDQQLPGPQARTGRRELVETSNQLAVEASSTEESDSDDKTCPFCAETIKAAAVVCRYCHSDLRMTVPLVPSASKSVNVASPPGRVIGSLPDQKAKRNDVKFLFVFWGLIIIVCICLSLCHKPETQSSSSAGPTKIETEPNIGDQGYLLQQTAAANTQQTFNDMNDTAAAKDTIGIARMVNEGSVAILPAGTRVLVLEVGIGKWFSGWYKVRVLNGTYVGQACYVASDRVKRLMVMAPSKS